MGSNPTPSAKPLCLAGRQTQFITNGEMAESAEGARLLSEYAGNTASRVRIPVSPPKTNDHYVLADLTLHLGSAFSIGGVGKAYPFCSESIFLRKYSGAVAAQRVAIGFRGYSMSE